MVDYREKFNQILSYMGVSREVVSSRKPGSKSFQRDFVLMAGKTGATQKEIADYLDREEISIFPRSREKIHEEFFKHCEDKSLDDIFQVEYSIFVTVPEEWKKTQNKSPNKDKKTVYVGEPIVDEIYKFITMIYRKYSVKYISSYFNNLSPEQIETYMKNMESPKINKNDKNLLTNNAFCRIFNLQTGEIIYEEKETQRAA